MGVTRDLAGFASSLSYESLPAKVIDGLKLMLFDQVGIACFVGTQTSWGRIATSYAHGAASAGGSSQVLGSHRRADAPRSALANGTLAMGFEFEDMHSRGTGHPFSIIFPAALAASEFGEKTGSDLLAALGAGYEVAVRASLGTRLSAEPMTERGIYPITIFGVIGAAAAAGNALSLPKREMLQAIGIAGSHAFGTMQSHAEGTMARRLNGGRAAEIGVTAALLAANGFTGPEEVLEGEYGIYNVFAGRTHGLEAITSGLGTSWATDGSWLKKYPCNGLFQAPLDLLLALADEYKFEASDVQTLRVCISRATPLHESIAPITSASAQTSLRYCMALALLRGEVTAEMFLEDRCPDPEVVGAMSRVDVTLDPDLRSRFEGSSRPGRVEVMLKDGRVLAKETAFPKGHPSNPLGWSDVRMKCESLLRSIRPDADAAALQSVISELDSAPVIPVLTPSTLD